MKRLLLKVWKYAKAGVIPVAAAAVPMAAAGQFGPKAQAAAVAAIALWGVFSKRPQDPHEPVTPPVPLGSLDLHTLNEMKRQGRL